MRIGILGGTFDPPHLGHLQLADAAKASLELDEVLFLPANRNPLKTRPIGTPGKYRLEMVRRLIAQDPSFAVSDMELTRGGMSYTVDTIGELLMVAPADYWFIIGADGLKNLHDWKSPQRLLRICRLAVAVRPPMTDFDVAARIPEEFRERVDVIKMEPSNVSSTEIRERLARRQAVTGLVPESVVAYIREQKLYQI